MRDKEPLVVSSDRNVRFAIPEKLKKYYPLLGMGMFPVMGLIYAAVNGPRGKVQNLVTALDTAIPLVKVFAIPYSIWIVFIYACVIYFLMKDRKVYYECLVTYALCALACYGIYAVFQTTVPRPVLYGDDPLTQLLRYIYRRDQPFNCFPSIHCFSCFMVMRALYKSHFKTKLNQTLIYGMATTIILSTFFVKQHVVLDAAAAFLLVQIIHRLVVWQSQAGWPLFRKLVAQVRSL
ncbi:phosphatase PAP2 family protein [Gorillibacterium timonense]|uniref:phosphatase PAP2 family protein n=1 Tax=Gorillibacterium timonense TaxID=1689269 RepID=UPI00071DAFCB|nr:phosphatase PAP2 family protein [Gorillibacterium timonense]